jgi:hypothetical protein
METLICSTAVAMSFALALFSARLTLRMVFRFMTQTDVR